MGGMLILDTDESIIKQGTMFQICEIVRIFLFCHELLLMNAWSCVSSLSYIEC